MRRVFLCFFVLAGCAPVAAPDAGLDDAASLDVGLDAALDETRDAGAPLRSCSLGTDCDGDHLGSCFPLCRGDACCVAQNGRYGCVPRGADGYCPRADLYVVPEVTARTAYVQWTEIPEESCAIFEGCVARAGWRRLLRFDILTANRGQADLHLGPPEGRPEFLFSACHNHYHFDGYARYELLDASGAVAARGHKQAFCLMDSTEWPAADFTGVARYDCENQGIQEGFADSYAASLDCQWIDVTDVAPGNYTIRAALDEMRVLPDADRSNDDARISFVLPPDADPLVACPRDGLLLSRDCGFRLARTATCTPGESLTVACSAACGIGTCTGDPGLRVCEGNTPCAWGPRVLATGELGCGPGACGGTDCCPRARVTCPPSGAITVLAGPSVSGGEASCEVVVR